MKYCKTCCIPVEDVKYCPICGNIPHVPDICEVQLHQIKSPRRKEFYIISGLEADSEYINFLEKNFDEFQKSIFNMCEKLDEVKNDM